MTSLLNIIITVYILKWHSRLHGHSALVVRWSHHQRHVTLWQICKIWWFLSNQLVRIWFCTRKYKWVVHFDYHSLKYIKSMPFSWNIQQNLAYPLTVNHIWLSAALTVICWQLTVRCVPNTHQPMTSQPSSTHNFKCDCSVSKVPNNSYGPLTKCSSIFFITSVDWQHWQDRVWIVWNHKNAVSCHLVSMDACWCHAGQTISTT